MRFRQLDKITLIEPNVRIEAVRILRADEDYLADHFPKFPVMPGVLMLEAMYQASAWLVRSSEDFANSVVLLREARNVKYADFVEPGETLVVSADIIKQDERHTTLKAQGTVDGTTAVSGRLILERYPLAERYPTRASSEGYVRKMLREEFEQLFQRDSAG
ncbi:MAG: beta-hydroxyacyl-ACP dehydratase [Planctomycetales bacterium]|nr:beta-hydroxyacyl-ACP dehydratase [Planctomycetales bacterium]